MRDLFAIAHGLALVQAGRTLAPKPVHNECSRAFEMHGLPVEGTAVGPVRYLAYLNAYEFGDGSRAKIQYTYDALGRSIGLTWIFLSV